MRRTPLRRAAGLARGKPLTRLRTLHRRSAAKEAKAEAERLVREHVFTRDGWLCQLHRSTPLYGAAGRLADDAGMVGGAHRLVRDCQGPLTPHHLRKAGQGGSYTADNLVTLCAFHNTWVEDHPIAATRLGLVHRPEPLGR